LEKLILARQYLRDLVAKLDGNDELNTVLSEIAANQDEVKKLKTEALPETDSPSGENDTGSKKSSDAGKK
jgi:type VI secretion system protein ImpB